MVQLRTQRTALALYGVLLVLPTLVLGFLQWHQIVQDKDSELAAVPREAEDAARRFRGTLDARLWELIGAEQERPFQHYAQFFCPESAGVDELPLLPSPLTREPRPEGLLCWFVFDLIEEDDARVDLFWGDETSRSSELHPQREDELREAVGLLIGMILSDGPLRRTVRLGDYTEVDLPLRSVAANRATWDDQQCLQAQREFLCENEVSLVTSEFFLQFYREDDGTPRVVASRRVLVRPMAHLTGMNECLHRLNRGLGLVQGFFVDPDWLFSELPQLVAGNVLDEAHRFVPMGAPDCCEGRTEYHAEIHPVADLGIDAVGEDNHYGALRIAADTMEIEARFRRRAWRFLGVAGMLALSLGTGMVLLLRSVSRDLEQAQRTENFVHAVTHELRTPLSAIKLHGEMLLDGWASDPKKQQTYYRRIVRETERLSVMVERVLQKARLASGTTRPFAGDLSSSVAELQPQLMRWEDEDEQRHDVRFDLAEDLPPVMMTSEAIVSIVVNLVENARKYAPVDTSLPDAEPIRVVTRRDGDAVVLEVLDRGPGIPPGERDQVFEAFFRMGREKTRTSRGTGLGLHLVALQADAIGAQAGVDGREGAGAAFWIRFQIAASDEA